MFKHCQLIFPKKLKKVYKMELAGETSAMGTKQSRIFGFRFSEDFNAEINAAARRAGKSRSDFVRDAIERAILEVGGTKTPPIAGRGTRTDMQNPEGRKRALKQLAAARAARKTFKGCEKKRPQPPLRAHPPPLTQGEIDAAERDARRMLGLGTDDYSDSGGSANSAA